jgi:hypothetical protein
LGEGGSGPFSGTVVLRGRIPTLIDHSAALERSNWLYPKPRGHPPSMSPVGGPTPTRSCPGAWT